MTNQISEQISALLDSELPLEQEELLLRRFGRSTNEQDLLGRYSLIGDMLRENECVADALHVADRVRTALDGESENNDADTSRRQASGSGFFGAAVAAAIAGVVMFNLTQFSERSGPPDALALLANSMQPAEHQHDPLAEPDRLARYLMAHSEYSNPVSRNFMDAHMTLVAFSPAALADSGALPR